MQKGNLVRFQVELDDIQNAKMEEMMRISRSRTKRKIHDAAFDLLYWAIKEVAAGRQIGSIVEIEDGTTRIREYHSTELDAAAPHL